MGNLARRVQERFRERLAAARPGLDWTVEHRVAGTPVDVAGLGNSVVLVELEWRRADPADNTAKLFRHLAEGQFDADRVVVAQVFTGYYDLARGGVSTKRENAEFVGRVAADTFDCFSYAPVDLAIDPPKRGDALPDDWRAAVDDVYWGCVTATGEQGLNIGRVAPMVAGWGDSVPGVQLNRMCGSSQQAVTWAAGQIRAGFADVVVAGGEHLTRVPMGADSTAESGIIARDALTDTYFEHYDEATGQGEGAERMAEQWGVSRERADRIAADSHRRWGEAWEAGHYDRAVVPVETTLDGEPATVDRDEHPRPDSTVDSLAGLPLAFRPEGEGVHHAGNSSGVVDGASALLMASEPVAADRGWDPLARVVDSVVVGVDPVTMRTGPDPATEQVLERAGREIGDVDLFEVNEAFASVVAAWLDETGAPWERTNVLGGAIAHGHPFGATGGALLGKLAYELDRRGADLGLCAMCIGFGQGIATLIERA
ncbi:MAG: thiolase family protein [Haloarculaceae archaeon]